MWIPIVDEVATTKASHNGGKTNQYITGKPSKSGKFSGKPDFVGGGLGVVLKHTR